MSEDQAKHNENSAEKEKFTREYVTELRNESASWRKKAEDLDNLVKKTQTDSDLKVTEAEKKIAESHTAAQARIIRAELKAHALSAGMVDVDGLKLADLSKIKLLDDDTLEGVDDLLKDLKEKKPYLFKENKSTSHSDPLPKSKAAEKTDVRKLSDEEYKKHKQKVIRSE